MNALHQLIAAEGQRPLEVDGSDWWQMTPAEQAVFNLDANRLPLMVAAWGAYEAFQGITSGAHWDMEHQASIDAAKAAQPRLAVEEFSRTGWANFAAAFSNLTMCECWQWWAKHEAWQARRGILSWADGSAMN